ncbi:MULTISPECIES: hypothetical protein [Micromonospora]|uniref:hypothetical protein n=1 Tax=Micromonospora TaxID=1873 RepID=UPI001EE8CCDF|nr:MULTISPECIES: hypothetical protein [Micromonospora]MCG5452254.1 hypothetical protein [Micromonospora hortensis]MCX5117883.1 hypothetical protein [Micromonospora sp. NBC_00362]
MPTALDFLAGPLCLALGVVFTLHAVRRLRTERRRGQRPRRRELLSGRELLWEGLAVALLGTANLLDRPWTLLAIPAVVVLGVLAVRILLRLIREHRS